MAESSTSTDKQVKKHHYARTFIASILGFIALALIIVSILVSWLDYTLTNTDQYVRTMSPLVSEPDVQNFVVTKASDVVLKNDEAPIREIAEQLFGKEQTDGKTDDQLRSETTVVVQDTVRSIIASPTFASLWETSNRDVHSSVLAQLESKSQTIELDFHPLIVGVIDQLDSTRLGFVKEKLELGRDVGVVRFEDRQIENVHRIYDIFKKAVVAVIGAAIITSLLCVFISVNHLKTLRRIALFTGIFCAAIATVLSSSSLIKTDAVDVEQQKLAIALVNAVTQDLRLGLFVIAAVCVIGAIVSKTLSVLSKHKKAQ